MSVGSGTAIGGCSRSAQPSSSAPHVAPTNPNLDRLPSSLKLTMIRLHIMNPDPGLFPAARSTRELETNSSPERAEGVSFFAYSDLRQARVSVDYRII